MNRKHLPLLVAFAAIATVSSANSQQRVRDPAERNERAYPSRIENPFFTGRDLESRFAWIAGSELVTSEGTLRLDLLRQVDRARIGAAFEEARTAASDGSGPLPCYPMRLGHAVFTRDRAVVMDQLVAGAVFAFTGEVVATEDGLGGGFMTPVTALEVQINEWLIEGRDFGTPDSVNVLYPAGTVSLGPLEICGSADGMPPPPDVGDRILMFPDENWRVGYPEDWPFISFSRFGYGVYEQATTRRVMSPSMIQVLAVREAREFDDLVNNMRDRARRLERNRRSDDR